MYFWKQNLENNIAKIDLPQTRRYVNLPMNLLQELKDETGRLYKLLSERDHEVRQLRKKSDQQRVASAAVGSNMAGDAAALKIVELSKKIRELTAELESEKSKCKQWAKKCFDMENEVRGICYSVGAFQKPLQARKLRTS